MVDFQDNKISERLKYLRKQLNLNQKEFAERIGYKQNTVSEAETGKRSIAKRYLETVVDKFNVSHAWLFTGIGTMFDGFSPDQEQQIREIPREHFEDIIKKAFKIDRLEDLSEVVNKLDAFAGGLDKVAIGNHKDKITQLGPHKFRVAHKLVPPFAEDAYLKSLLSPTSENFNDYETHEVLFSSVSFTEYRSFIMVGDLMDDGTIDSIPDRTVVTGYSIGKDYLLYSMFYDNYFQWAIVHSEKKVLIREITDFNKDTGEISLKCLKNGEVGEVINIDDVLELYPVVSKTLPESCFRKK